MQKHKDTSRAVLIFIINKEIWHVPFDFPSFFSRENARVHFLAHHVVESWRCFFNPFTAPRARRDFRRPCASVNDGMAYRRKNEAVKSYWSGNACEVNRTELIVPIYCIPNTTSPFRCSFINWFFTAYNNNEKLNYNPFKVKEMYVCVYIYI